MSSLSGNSTADRPERRRPAKATQISIRIYFNCQHSRRSSYFRLLLHQECADVIGVATHERDYCRRRFRRRDLRLLTYRARVCDRLSPLRHGQSIRAVREIRSRQFSGLILVVLMRIFAQCESILTFARHRFRTFCHAASCTGPVCRNFRRFFD